MENLLAASKEGNIECKLKNSQELRCLFFSLLTIYTQKQGQLDLDSFTKLILFSKDKIKQMEGNDHHSEDHIHLSE